MVFERGKRDASATPRSAPPRENAARPFNGEPAVRSLVVPEMRTEELERTIARRFGLRPRDRWRRDLPSAFETLARRRGLTEPQLLQLVHADSSVLRELAGLLTIEETFFFRFPDQVALAVQHVGRRWRDTPEAEFVIWSAGCSTGEEPYSLAIGLRDTFGPLASRCRVVACDLNADAIARAREAIYGGWSFRGVAAELRDRCFTSSGSDRYRLAERYREAVRFEHLSIQEMASSFAEQSVEVIFFRNVGLYLDDSARAQCYEAFARVLTREGLLVQAATDPTPPQDRFVRRAGLLVGAYRPLRAGLEGPPRAPVEVPEPPPLLARSLSLHPAPHEEAMALADRGQLERALRAAQHAVDESPMDPARFVLRGQILLAANRADEAAEDFRRALFLAPESSLTRYWYILALQSTPRPERAESHVRALTRELLERPEAELLEDGVTRVGELLKAAVSLEAFCSADHLR